MNRITVIEGKLSRGTEAALWDIFGRHELANLFVRRGLRAGLIVAKELPGGLFFKP